MNNNYKIRHQEVMMRTRSIFTILREEAFGCELPNTEKWITTSELRSERASSNCLPAKPLFRLEKLVKCITLRIETRVEPRIQHSSLFREECFYFILHHTRIGRRIRGMHHDEKNKIGLTVALSIVVGTIIGSGVFMKPGSVLDYSGSSNMAILAWIIGGLLTLASGLTVAEIGAQIPKNGGLYTYLEEIYGSFGDIYQVGCKQLFMDMLLSEH